MYRSVLLNNGPRQNPKPDTSSSTPKEQATPTSGCGSGTEASVGEESTVAPKDALVDQLLYRPEIEVGSRGDIIQFYNKLFIGFIKDFVLRFSPNEAEVCMYVCVYLFVNQNLNFISACTYRRALSLTLSSFRFPHSSLTDSESRLVSRTCHPQSRSLSAQGLQESQNLCVSL